MYYHHYSVSVHCMSSQVISCLWINIPSQSLLWIPNVLSTCPSGEDNSVLILHSAVCKITMCFGSAVPVPGAVHPERVIQRERETGRERDYVSTSQTRKQTVASVSSTITICAGIFQPWTEQMSTREGELAAFMGFLGKLPKCNAPQRRWWERSKYWIFCNKWDACLEKQACLTAINTWHWETQWEYAHCVCFSSWRY